MGKNKQGVRNLDSSPTNSRTRPSIICLPSEHKWKWVDDSTDRCRKCGKERTYRNDMFDSYR